MHPQPERTTRTSLGRRGRPDNGISCVKAALHSGGETHGETGLVHECGRGVPRLHLVAEDDLDLACVLAVALEEGLQDAVDGERDLRAERADVVHCAKKSARRRGVKLLARTEELERVRSVMGARDDESGTQAGLEGHDVELGPM